ncbi:hypothetical protein [Labrys sp. ZIDIC5]|uniref:hypothetical protein n=1 Tax=Labrys sedimenti TaxID=3106036 RepID=UPI002ACA56DC|nr:hypothetical protein [Labrys sp. ZIDIC5]MDZ5452710.1 hypothetical protein [Labrys sp. ZIDIC5]
MSDAPSHSAEGRSTVLTYRLAHEEVLLWRELAAGRRNALRQEPMDQSSYYYLPVLLLAGVVILLALIGAIGIEHLQLALAFGLAGYLITRLCDFSLSKWHARKALRHGARRRFFEGDYRIAWDTHSISANIPDLSLTFARSTIGHVSDLKGLVVLWMDELDSSLAIPHRAFEDEAARRQFATGIASKRPEAGTNSPAAISGRD